MAFWIKICGITNVEDARAAAQAGADALGLNFFNQSRRFVKPRHARTIAENLPSNLLKVGVFVNHDVTQIADIVQHVGLDAVQLHGDEPAAIVSKLPTNVRVIRAFRCGGHGLAPLVQYLDDCHALGRLPDALLIDADAGPSFGGSGTLADWNRIRHEKHALGELPMLLAGGLTPDNVAAAISAVEPNGVDVASGVEREPGQKDRVLIARFVTIARRAATHLS